VQNNPSRTLGNDTKLGRDNNATGNSSNEMTMPADHGYSSLLKNSSAVLRAVYVACGIVVLVVIYNLVMTRLRRKKNKAQLYGLLNTNSDMEMTPLDQEDDDETTMFDASVYKNRT